jgi:hypothetical protein
MTGGVGQLHQMNYSYIRVKKNIHLAVDIMTFSLFIRDYLNCIVVTG